MEHEHSHAPANYGDAFAVGVALKPGFVIAEIIDDGLALSLALRVCVTP